MEKSELHLLTLAALLHDIGKFAQRAGALRSDQLADTYCPTGAGGQSTHLHVLYGDHFIENVLPLPESLEPQRSKLARLASSHHKPDTGDLLEMALCRADRLSAGTDRSIGEAVGDYKKARLLSVFELVSLHGTADKDGADCRHYPLAPIEESAFPVTLGEATKSSYEDLYKRFVDALSGIPIDVGVEHYLASLGSLLERFTWCIPSSTYKTLPDISLYDHAVTTAAIAQSVYAYHSEQGGLPGDDKQDTEKFILCGGDLSGIQKYIFEVDKSHGSGVAKLFRARSLYLQAVTRSVIIAITRRLGLNLSAKIMDAGGRFMLLLPDTDRVKQALSDVERDVQQWFFDKFGGEVSLTLSMQTELTEDDFAIEQFQRKLDEFNDQLEAAKLKKFHRLMADGMSPVIDLDYQAFVADGDCRICKKRPVDSGARAAYQKAYDRDVPLCKSCSDQISHIGKRLPNGDAMVFCEKARPGSVEMFGGLHLYITDKSNARSLAGQAAEIVNYRKRGDFSFSPVAAHMPTITEADLQHQGLMSGRNGQGVESEDLKVGQPKTFQHLALMGRGDDSCGKPFLAALKADVDNLGAVFSLGLQERLSISRYASLSRLLNHFFAEYLVRRIEKDYPDTYTVFAGGDDLFLIGPWADVVRLTREIGAEFRRFVAYCPDVTLSSGIAVCKPTLPVHAIADMGEGMLEKSKSYSHDGQSKNAVTLFDTTVTWTQFDDLLDRGDWLHGLIDRGAVPMGLGSRLLYYGNEHKAFMAGEVARGIYRSHMSYDFSRNISDKKVKDVAERQRLLGIQQDELMLDHMRLPVSWALYRLRNR